jgi:hypothetical protein
MDIPELVVDGLHIPLFGSKGNSVVGAFDNDGTYSMSYRVDSKDGRPLLVQFEAWANKEGFSIMDRHAASLPNPISVFLLQLYRPPYSVRLGFSGPLPAQPWPQLMIALYRH